MNSKVSAVQPHLSKQGMSRKARVYLRNQLDGSLQSLAVGFAVDFAGTELAGTEVVVHMPHANAAARGDAAQQGRTAAVQTDRRQPAFGDQFIAAGDLRLQAFDHNRASLAIDGKAQAVNGLRPPLERLLVKQTTRAS